ncbi:cytochrome c oxidase assembly protein [Comamonas sp.]
MNSAMAGIEPTYCGLPPAPADLPAAWNGDWRLLLALTVLAAAVRYTQRRGLFAAGWLVLVVAFVSPLCALTVALFSARALHHLLLLSVAAPLLGAAFVQLGQRVASGVALMVVVVVLALWHVPAVYTQVWGSELWYWAMQLALLLPAAAFWSRILAVLRAGAEVSSDRILTALSHIGALAAVMGLIGAVLTFAPEVLYAEHGLAGLAYGLQPLEDQQLAGLLMWVPGFVPLAVIAGAVLYRAWHHATQQASVRQEATP